MQGNKGNRIKELFGTCCIPARQKKRFMALKPDPQFRRMAILELKEKAVEPDRDRVILFVRPIR